MFFGVSLLVSLCLIPVFVSLAYLYLLTIASLFPRRHSISQNSPGLRFAVAVPAHNEASVIQRTVATILACEYPFGKIDVFVVADHCSDETAQVARLSGAKVYERDQGERGKGAALSWLFERIFENNQDYQVVAIFDADTVVHPQFFKTMSARFAAGAQVIQGKHVIRNPQAGWFPALTWAMFIIDNRFQNLGRSNLGFSAKNMGDSICFHSEILKKYGWGSGLTEDYAFRQRLLLEGIRFGYEPEAVGFGDAAINWKEAAPQRQRWLRGAYQSSRQYARSILIEGLKRLDPAILDGALQAYLPSYSTLTLIACSFFLLTLVFHNSLWFWLPWAWVLIFILLFLFPLLNLAFERAPLRAFLVILTGPVFIIWRTWLSVYARFLRRQVEWVRTPRHNDNSTN